MSLKVDCTLALATLGVLSLALAGAARAEPAFTAGLEAGLCDKDHRAGRPFRVGNGWAQRFDGSRLDWGDGLCVLNPQAGKSFIVKHGFRLAYQGRVQSRLGLPLEDEHREGPVVIQRFERGYLTWNEQENIRVHFTARPDDGLLEAEEGGRPLTAATRRSHFAARLAPPARSAIKEVPLVALPAAELFLANHDAFRELGLLHGPNGLETDALRQQSVAAFAFRPATEQEIRDKSYTHVGLATRYEDTRGAGGVRGDGRAALIGDVLVRDRRTSAFVGVFDIQVKGVATGLNQSGTGATDLHGTGRSSLAGALCDAVASDVMHRNGIATNRWLAVVDTKDEYSIQYPWASGLTKEHGALFIRGGNFIRLAHLYYFRNDPVALGSLLDHLAHQVARARGQRRPLSRPALLAALVETKARELAQTYWARVAHGSATIDNVGLLESVDHGTTGTVDRAHPTYAYNTACSLGFARDAGLVLGEYYSQYLVGLMRLGTPLRERAALDAQASRVRARMSTILEGEMARAMLPHLGLEATDVERVLRRNPGAVRALLAAVRRIGETAAPGVSYRMGSGGEAEVKDPARVDIFRTLARLPLAALLGRSDRARTGYLAKRMGSLVADRAWDARAAEELIRAAQPVYETALQGLAGPVRREKIRLVADQARRINQPLDLSRMRIDRLVGDLVSQWSRGQMPRQRVAAELNALVRASDRRGPESALGVARDFRSGAARRGRMVDAEHIALARAVEGGVRIEEQSDGVAESVRVSLAGNPLQLGDPRRYRMRYTDDGVTWQEASPLLYSGREVVYQVPLQGKSSRFEVSFFDAGDPKRRYDNGGAGFGKGLSLLSRSPLVDAHLGLWAARRGLTRPGTKPDRVRAVLPPLLRRTNAR